ncbi:MAG: hypothetical protein R2724_33490 [Bryobacterales bacterium]
MPRLLFVTDPEELAAAVGREAALHARSLVRAAGQPLVEASGVDLLRLTRATLTRMRMWPA